jgi:hypothetical protein
MNSLLSVYGINDKKAKSMDGERRSTIKRASFVANENLTRLWSKSMVGGMSKKIDEHKGVRVSQLLDAENFCVLDYDSLELVQFAAVMFEVSAERCVECVSMWAYEFCVCV